MQGTPLFLLLLLQGFSGVWLYLVPSPKVEILSKGFRVSIRDEPDIKKVVYITTVNEQCALSTDLRLISENREWTVTYNSTQLKNNDQILIRILVQNKEDMYKRTDHLIVKNNHALSINVPENDITNELDISCDDDRNGGSMPTKCDKSKTTIQNILVQCKDDLLFADEFENNGTPNLHKWSYDVRLRLDGQNTEEFSVFTDDIANCFVRDDILHIVPTPNTRGKITEGNLNLGKKCTPIPADPIIGSSDQCNVTAILGAMLFLPPVYSAQIITKNSFVFTYGRIEIRAQIPRGDWILPYIMLQPKSGGLSGPQLRIAFARGNTYLMDPTTNIDIGGSHLYGGAVWWQPGGSGRMSDLRDTKSVQHYGDDFHNYTLIWQEDQILLAVDGKQYGMIDDSSTLNIFKQACYITLGVSVGGHQEFPSSLEAAKLKPWNNTSPKAALKFWQAKREWLPTWNGAQLLKVDYVRVYAV